MSGVPLHGRPTPLRAFNYAQGSTDPQQNPSPRQDSTNKERAHATPLDRNPCEIASTWFLKRKADIEADININDSQSCLVHFRDTKITRNLNEYAYGHPVIPLRVMDEMGSRYLVAVVTSFKNMPIEEWRSTRIQRDDLFQSVPIVSALPAAGEAVVPLSSNHPVNNGQVNYLYLARGWFDKPTYVRIDRLLDIPKSYMKPFLYSRESEQPSRLSFASYQALLTTLNLGFDAYKPYFGKSEHLWEGKSGWDFIGFPPKDFKQDNAVNQGGRSVTLTRTTSTVATIRPELPTFMKPFTTAPTLKSDPTLITGGSARDMIHDLEGLATQLEGIKISGAMDEHAPSPDTGNGSQTTKHYPTRTHACTSSTPEQTLEETISPKHIILSSMQDPLVLGMPYEEFGRGFNARTGPAHLGTLNNSDDLKIAQSTSNTNASVRDTRDSQLPSPTFQRQRAAKLPTAPDSELPDTNDSPDTPEIEKTLRGLISQATAILISDGDDTTKRSLIHVRTDSIAEAQSSPSSSAAASNESSDKNHGSEIDAIHPISAKSAGKISSLPCSRRGVSATTNSEYKSRYRGEKRTREQDLAVDKQLNEYAMKIQKTNFSGSFTRLRRTARKSSKLLVLRMKSRFHMLKTMRAKPFKSSNPGSTKL